MSLNSLPLILSTIRSAATTGITAASRERLAQSDVVVIEINPDVLARATTGCRFQFSEAFLHMLVKRLSVANTRVSHLLADHDLAEDG